MKNNVEGSSLIIILFVLLTACKPSTVSREQCTTDENCKVIYSSCGCAAVSAHDTETFIKEDKVCIVNSCMTKQTTTICSKSQCILKENA